MFFAASVERQRVLAAELVIGSAATLRLVDGTEFVDRIKPALETLGGAWVRLECDLAQLSGWRRADAELSRAAEEMRAGLRELTHEGARLASPQTMTDRTDLVVAGRSLQPGASLSSEAAHATREALDETEWEVPARGAPEVYQARGVAPTHLDSAAVWMGASVPLSDEGMSPVVSTKNGTSPALPAARRRLGLLPRPVESRLVSDDTGVPSNDTTNWPLRD